MVLITSKKEVAVKAVKEAMDTSPDPNLPCSAQHNRWVDHWYEMVVKESCVGYYISKAVAEKRPCKKRQRHIGSPFLRRQCSESLR